MHRRDEVSCADGSRTIAQVLKLSLSIWAPSDYDIDDAVAGRRRFFTDADRGYDSVKQPEIFVPLQDPQVIVFASMYRQLESLSLIDDYFGYDDSDLLPVLRAVGSTVLRDFTVDGDAALDAEEAGNLYLIAPIDLSLDRFVALEKLTVVGDVVGDNLLTTVARLPSVQHTKSRE